MTSNVLSEVPVFNVSINDLVESKANDIVTACEHLLKSPAFNSCIIYNKVFYIGKMPAAKVADYVNSVKKTIEKGIPESVKEASNIIRDKGYKVVESIFPLCAEYYTYNYLVEI